MEIATIFAFILQILIYYLIQKYTSNMEKKTDCDCATLEKLEQFKNYNKYNLILFFIEIVYIMFVYVPNIDNDILLYILTIISLISMFLRISQIVYWRSYVSDKKHIDCECLLTNRFWIINVLVWLNIIYYIVFKLPLLIFIIIMYSYNNKEFIKGFETGFKGKIKDRFTIN